MFHKYLLIPVFVASCSYLLLKHGHKVSQLEVIKDTILKVFSSNSSSKNSESDSPIRLFSAEELASYVGENDGPIYLSILGNVFDVTKGRKHYSKSGSYSVFAGKDASKAFVTGDFSEAGASDDISQLSLDELGDLSDWLQMYKKDYEFKGKLIGRFYEKDGSPTPFLRSIDDKLSSLASRRQEDDLTKTRYPPCNVEWSPDIGSRFWCSKQSGGIRRDWIGVPRKMYDPSSGVESCVCLNISPGDETSASPERKFTLYQDCPSTSTSCTVQT